MRNRVNGYISSVPLLWRVTKFITSLTRKHKHFYDAVLGYVLTIYMIYCKWPDVLRGPCWCPLICMVAMVAYWCRQTKMEGGQLAFCKRLCGYVKIMGENIASRVATCHFNHSSWYCLFCIADYINDYLRSNLINQTIQTDASFKIQLEFYSNPPPCVL